MDLESKPVTTTCRIYLESNEHSTEIAGWPEVLLTIDPDRLDVESLLFRSGAKTVILHRPSGYAKFVLQDDKAQMELQDVPPPEPIRTLHYVLEGWHPFE